MLTTDIILLYVNDVDLLLPHEDPTKLQKITIHLIHSTFSRYSKTLHSTLCSMENPAKHLAGLLFAHEFMFSHTHTPTCHVARPGCGVTEPTRGRALLGSVGLRWGTNEPGNPDIMRTMRARWSLLLC